MVLPKCFIVSTKCIVFGMWQLFHFIREHGSCFRVTSETSSMAFWDLADQIKPMSQCDQTSLGACLFYVDLVYIPPIGNGLSIYLDVL